MSFGNSIATFKKQIEQNETISAFREMQSFSHCYPYMNRNVLIRNLGDAWELFCEKKEMIRKQAHKKVLTLQADNKVDPVVLSAAISVRDEAIGKFQLYHGPMDQWTNELFIGSIYNAFPFF